MVNGPQISLKNIFLSFGEKQIFEGLNLLIQPRDRIALVGRNGRENQPFKSYTGPCSSR